MEEKIKFQMEFPIHASPKMLYQYFGSSSGLSEWFADNVNSRGEVFTFIWDGTEEKAKVLSKKSDLKIRFKWLESEDDDSYFEFRIQVDELTKDVSLMITDFFFAIVSVEFLDFYTPPLFSRWSRTREGE